MEFTLQRRTAISKNYYFSYPKVIVFSIICFLICIGDLFSISIFNYIDDILGLISFLFLVFTLFQREFRKEKIILFLFFLLGFFCALFTDQSRNTLLLLADFFFSFKFVFIFLMFQKLSKKQRFGCAFVKQYAIFSLVTIFLMFPVCLHQKLNGMERAVFFSNYAGTVGFYSFLFLVIHFVCLYFKIVDKRYFVFFYFGIIMDVLTCFLSRSSTAEFFIILLGLLGLFVKFTKNRLVFLFFSLLAFILFGFLSKNKIENYFLNSLAPRSLLYQYALLFLRKRFPFGLGFSFFGGKIASDFYSPIYESLGWKNTYILGENSPFLLDAYFPTIIGETGFIGIVLFICLVVRMIKLIWKPDNKEINFFSILLFVCLVLSAIPFNFINSGIGTSFIIICLCFRNLKTSKIRNSRFFI